MSQADVDVVVNQFAATNEQDFERAMDAYADDVVLVASEDTGPNVGTFAGKEAVGEWFGDWFRAFAPGYRFEIQEARDLEGGLVFLRATHRGEGRRSGVVVESENVYLYRVRDGKITRVGFFVTSEEALDTASLPEWSNGETH